MLNSPKKGSHFTVVSPHPVSIFHTQSLGARNVDLTEALTTFSTGGQPWLLKLDKGSRAGAEGWSVLVESRFSPSRCPLLTTVCKFPGLVSELPCKTQKAAASERLLPGHLHGEDAPISARGNPLFSLQQPGPATSTDPARIPGQ